MKPWKLIVFLVLLLLPILTILIAGGISLWWHGWYTWVWWAMPVCWGLATVWILMNRPAPTQASREPPPSLVWSTRDNQAWDSIVLDQVKKSEELPLKTLTDPKTYTSEGLVLADRLAKAYHPGMENPYADLTVLEILTAIELAAKDFSEIVRSGLPASHLLTVQRFQQLSQVPKWYSRLSNLGWAVSAVLNPVGTAVRYLGSRFTINPFVEEMQSNVLRWLFASYLKRLGQHLIEMHSGRLRVGAERWLELNQEAERILADRPDGEKTEKVEIQLALVGQVSSGKSSVVNAILGGEQAKVDVLPETRKVTRYVLDRADLPIRITLLDTAGWGTAERSAKEFEAAVATAVHAHAVLHIFDANMAARESDRLFLEAWKTWFETRPNTKKPPLLGVMTHIDVLPPSLEWKPPYDTWMKPSPVRVKDRMIGEALKTIQEPFVPPLEGVVPVCAAPGKVFGITEFLWPAILQLLPEAKAKRIHAAFLSESTQTHWKQLWTQIQTSASTLAKIGLLGKE